MQLSDLIIRTELKPGDLGYITYRHGALYSNECQYGIEFESYVAQGLHEFFSQYDAGKDRVWLAEYEGRIAGSLILMHRPGNAAQLRCFLIEPEFRGIGLGRKLMDLFMDFYREKGYTSCYLWTTHEQEPAIALYKRYGFQLTEEKPSTAFGKALTEQRYDLVS
ncbi:GNAT family N-acetyltransferase [Pontibacter indicus]|uniref:Peptidyl-dipeptidase Dcp n=1 Tax=Pontibacter indicus TaxID=1317125 RepID=A0A1R3XKA6_9BACT|nr:GNAT family N-acetyltransferase [Pontibacter indicus]SIT91955.1 peptidyl-dipeptidase Dcp [Pontibacter indicus]